MENLFYKQDITQTYDLKGIGVSVLLKMAGSGYRRFARSRLYEYILVVMRFYYCI